MTQTNDAAVAASGGVSKKAVLLVFIGLMITELLSSLNETISLQPCRPLSASCTASNNYFHQIGAVVGVSIVSRLFAVRLVHLLADQIAGGWRADRTRSYPN